MWYKFFSRKNIHPVFSDKLVNRIEKIPTADLPMWADQVLTELGRALSAYEKTGDENVLRELLLGAESLHAIVDALHTRKLL